MRQDPDRLKRFRREAEVAANLKHPNLATIDTFFATFIPLADALAHAHQGRIHRDLKPGNIMVTPDGRTELFYVSDYNLVAVTVSTEGEFSVGIPEALFSGDQFETRNRHYDVSADRQKSVMEQDVGGGATTTITVVENGYTEFSDQD